MRSIIRSKYEPVTGDYHDKIVYDPVWGKIWLFDCDGTFLDMSKTNVIVVNEAGDSDTYAISQQFVTNAISDLNTSINNVDEASQIRAATIEAGLEQAVEELEAGIENATAEAIRRETQLANTLNAHVNVLDNDIENLTTVTNNLTDLINTVNRTAVFDVRLVNNDSLALSVTDGTQTSQTTIREASATRNGLMSTAAFNQLAANTEAIAHLQNAGLYRGSFETLADAPTATPSEEFIGGEAFNNDFISVQHAEYQGETGIARYRIAVNNSVVSYAFEAFIDKEIQNFTEGHAGLIVGGTADGTVAAQANGVGKVNGWDAMADDVTDAVSDIAALDTRVDDVEDDITSLSADVAAAQGNISTLQTNVSNLQSSVATNTQNISNNTTDITSLKNKAVEGSTQTTLGANSEALLTAAGMMNHWVDVTQSGMPANPDANTFYYTTA